MEKNIVEWGDDTLYITPVTEFALLMGWIFMYIGLPTLLVAGVASYFISRKMR